MQKKNLNLRLEQESHKRSLSQSELKMQSQQVSVLRSSEKQLKQELNHLLDMKQTLDKQNQELRRSKHQNNLMRQEAEHFPVFCSAVGGERVGSVGSWPAAAIDRLLVVFQGEAGGGWPAEGAERPAGGRAVFHGNSKSTLFAFCFSAPTLQNDSDGENRCKMTTNPHVCTHKKQPESPSLLPLRPFTRRRSVS